MILISQTPRVLKKYAVRVMSGRCASGAAKKRTLHNIGRLW
ncbi:hypothetical protein C4J98_2503 [Pseudomonas orientalis]|nr:hypothetical protein C4J98_2503 [Pseudomonas orientalis]